MSGRATLLTCGYRKDIERFALLRESYERCGVEIPHVAVVHTEDLSLFRDLPWQRHLTLLTTAQVLPKHIERGRTAQVYRRRHPLHWIGRKPIGGWWTQQMVKLSSPDFISTPGILSLDSDAFFVRPIQDEDFFAVSGRLHFYEAREGITVTNANWLGRAMHFLGVSTDNPVRQYIHNPVPMHREVILGLRRCIEAKYKKHWIAAMLAWNATEYCSYAVFAKYLNNLDHLELVRPQVSQSYWTEKDVVDFQTGFPARLRDPMVKIASVQQHTGLTLADFRTPLEAAWSRLTERPVVAASERSARPANVREAV
jgi:hypothetical protein